MKNSQSLENIDFIPIITLLKQEWMWIREHTNRKCQKRERDLLIRVQT